MRLWIGLMIVLSMLSQVEAATDTHVYGVTKSESVNTMYVTHLELPEWAVKGEGLLWHWKGKDGKWWQIRGKTRYLLARYPSKKRTYRPCYT